MTEIRIDKTILSPVVCIILNDNRFTIMDTNWHSRYNQMKSSHGLTNDDVARITKLSESNVRSQVTRADNGGIGQLRFPPWLKLAIVLDERKAFIEPNI